METKQQIRNRHISVRNALDETDAVCLSSKISRNLKVFFNGIKNLEQCGVYGYYPCRKEVSLFDLYAWLLERKIPLAFPRVDGETMDFYLISSMEEFEEGAFHIMEPCQNCKKAELPMAFCLVPGSVFDYSGSRLGYGKGYYDRYFAVHDRLCRIGIAYENQIETSVCTEKHDIKMQALITEKKMYFMNKEEDVWN